MNTMADGARDRCVAQIGESLFGQPGLTLMELAEKVKALLPSRGGQDAHEMADALERIAAGSLSDYEGVDADELHILQCAKLIRYLAARQPVGQEPYGWVCTGPNGTLFLPLSARDTMEVNAKYMPVVAVYAAPPAQAVELGPRPINTAPRDGTMVRLLVQFEDNATEDTAEPAWTIGACNDDNVGEDERVGWQFAGWCWTHDHFTEGKGTPVGWLPLIDSKAVGK